MKKIKAKKIITKKWSLCMIFSVALALSTFFLPSFLVFVVVFAVIFYKIFFLLYVVMAFFYKFFLENPLFPQIFFIHQLLPRFILNSRTVGSQVFKQWKIFRYNQILIIASNFEVIMIKFNTLLSFLIYCSDTSI